MVLCLHNINLFATVGGLRLKIDKKHHGVILQPERIKRPFLFKENSARVHAGVGTKLDYS